MGYYDYTPLDAPYPMSWPARECGWCGDGDLAWAYPLGDVTFWRVLAEGGEAEEIPHVSQPWFACARCKSFLDGDRWDELADEVGVPRGHWERLRVAKSTARGYPWGVPRRLSRR